nr:hypothetical protein CFP56_70261 [Quercus suber]
MIMLQDSSNEWGICILEDAWSRGNLSLPKMRMSNRPKMRINKLNMKELSLLALDEMDSLVEIKIINSLFLRLSEV